jgi:hypothetical protein
MREYINMGVDGVITNYYPEVLRQILRNRI